MMKNKEPYYFLDLLKLMALVAISVFHANEFIFFEDASPVGLNAPIWYFISVISRIFALGGHIIVAIAFFLFGLSSKPKKSLLHISVFALFGQMVLTLVYLDGGSVSNALNWDIYGYIAFSCVSIAYIPLKIRTSWWTSIISFIFLMMPQSFYQNLISHNKFWSVITGKLDYSIGAWPILPWFFLALMSYQLGYKAAKNINNLEKISRKEILVWGILFVLSIPYFGAYYWAPIGPNFYHFIFSQAPIVFWANFVFFIFWIRVSFHHKVQNFLRELSLMRFLSRLYWNRHLGITYIASIVYLGLGMNFSEEMLRSPILFDLYFILLMPISELASRGIFSLSKNFMKWRTL